MCSIERVGAVTCEVGLHGVICSVALVFIPQFQSPIEALISAHLFAFIGGIVICD
jgi:hypothetical protein